MYVRVVRIKKRYPVADATALMVVGCGTAEVLFTETMLVLWPIGQLSRSGFHYHTDNGGTAFHELPTALALEYD